MTSVAATAYEDEFLPSLVEQLKKKKMHDYMLKDPRRIGTEKLLPMDVLFTWSERACRLEKKSRICKCILNGIKDMVEKASIPEVGQELATTNHYQQYTRSQRNNLNLK